MQALFNRFNFLPVFDTQTRGRVTERLLGEMGSELWTRQHDVATSIYSPGVGYYVMCYENKVRVYVFCGMREALKEMPRSPKRVAL